MELESQNTRQTYIQMLSDVLKKKLEILNELMNLTMTQEEILKQEAFDENAFSNTIESKGEKLEALSKLDIGFEQIYDSVREELAAQKAKYYHEITQMQNYITSITDYSVKLQALENRNKSRLEQILTQKRRDINKSRLNSQTVAKYYKTMANQSDVSSYFYDKKK